MIRLSPMNRPLWARVLAVAALCGTIAGPAFPQMPGSTELDSGRFFVYDHGNPVANESFSYSSSGDSIVITALHSRRLRRDDGAVRGMVKKLGMVVDGFDFGLRSYTSNLDFDGHSTVRGIVPATEGDTAMTLYHEYDGAGTADRVVQPPGRLFVMDPMLFTLFDVVCRNVGGRVFASRPIQVVSLGPEPGCSEALVTSEGLDTLRWGGRRVPTHRYVMSDSSSRFTMWTTDKGEMLRLENRDADLVVLREPPATPAPKKPRTAPAPRKSGAR